MSFFDDDEPPTRAAQRPRSPAAVGGGRPEGPTEQQQMLVRRAVALGALALVLILLVVAVKGCRDSAKRNALRDYNTKVHELIGESDTQVGLKFFAQIGQRQSPTDKETSINALRVLAEDEATRAKSWSVPGDMVAAQRNLVLALDFRAEGLGKIADRISSAFASNADTARAALNQIAGEMQVFLASDVIYTQRVEPLIQETLDSNGVHGQSIASTQFVPNLGWLLPTFVAQRLTGNAALSSPTGTVAPGLHGHGLTGVTVGTTTLQPSPGVNRISTAGGVTFTVKFQNQGTNDEVGVGVRIQIRGAGRPTTVTKTVSQTKAGAPAQVSVALGRTPPTGTPVTIGVTVLAVPGEKKTDNNKQTYTAIFTR